MHYRVSYAINRYYHIYVSGNINGNDALNVVNAERCQRYAVNNGQIESHLGPFNILAFQNGVSSIFFTSSDAPRPNANHVYVDGGTADDAFQLMLNLLNQINNDIHPHIIIL